jgi:hypothetical protein
MIAIGDITERALRLIGITKERVSAIAGRDCGCKKRQQAMNEAGYVWQGKLLVPIRRVLFYREEMRHRWQSIRYGRIWRRLHMAAHHLWMAGKVLFYGR